MLPNFPQFKKLELNDREEIEKITKKYPPYSDFNFFNMWSWDVKEEMEISLLNRNLVVKFTDYITTEPFYSFLGENQVNETIQTLFDLCKKEGLEMKLKLISEESIKNLDLGKYKIEEDRDNFDYIYDIEKLCKYTGRDFSTKKNLVNRFSKHHPNSLVKNLNLSDQKTIEDISELNKLWVENKLKKNDEIIEHESVALDRALLCLNDFHLVVVGVYSNNKLISFCVNELLDGKTALAHFAKDDKSSSGSHAFLMRENAKILRGYGKKYLNYEQDLGKPNLRHAKNSFRPTSFLKKFVCTYKS